MEFVRQSGTPFGERVQIVFTTKQDESPLGLEKSRPLIERVESVRAQLKLNHVVVADQVHRSDTTLIRSVPQKPVVLSPQADGLATTLPNVGLVIVSSDCFGVFIYNETVPALLGLHVGWRGISQELVAKSLQTAQEEFSGWTKEQTWAYVGVGIRACHYRANRPEDESKRAALLARAPESITLKGGEYVIDLPQAIRAQLVSAGVQKRKIIEDGRCSADDVERFYSHWLQGPRLNGSSMTLGWLT